MPDAGDAIAAADAGPGESAEALAPAAVTQAAEVSDVHPLLASYRESVGSWLSERERGSIDRIDASGTGLADGAALAGEVSERAVRELLPAILDRVGSKQLRRDARDLRTHRAGRTDEYGEESSGDLLANYALVDFESAECDPTGRGRGAGFAQRCRIAFAAARLLGEPLGQDLRWPRFRGFGNCPGEPGHDPQDEMPCFTAGGEGGPLTVLLDFALAAGVPRRKVVAFAVGTFADLARGAAEQTRVAQLEFVPIGSARLSAIVHGLRRWMTAAEWRRFERATGIGPGSGVTVREEEELLHRIGVRLFSPLWARMGTAKGRELARALKLGLSDDEELLAFAPIFAAIDDGELLGSGELLQCPQRPEARFARCAVATEATSTLLWLAEWSGEPGAGGAPDLDPELLAATESMLEQLVSVGVPRAKLIRELTAAFAKSR